MDKPVSKAGRPTMYNDQMQERAEQYLFEFNTQGDVVPSHAGLCCWLGVVKSTIYEWAKHHPEFSNTLQAILVKQETLIVNNGLEGKYNATIAKLMMANHGYSDKQEIDHTSKDGSMSPKGKSLDDFYGDKAIE